MKLLRQIISHYESPDQSHEFQGEALEEDSKLSDNLINKKIAAWSRTLREKVEAIGDSPASTIDMRKNMELISLLPAPVENYDSILKEMLETQVWISQREVCANTMNEACYEIAKSKLDFIPEKVLILIEVPKDYEPDLGDQILLYFLISKFTDLNGETSIMWNLASVDYRDEVSVDCVIGHNN